MEYSRFLLSGSGGQGVITMGILMAETASLQSGLNAIQSQSYGPEARGGATRCDVLISDKPIYYPKVQLADVLVCLTQEAFNKYHQYLAPSGLLLTDAQYVNIPASMDAVHFALPMHEKVIETFKKPQVYNICVLGALLQLTGVVASSAVEKTLRERFDERFFENNKKALDMGINMAKAATATPC